MGGGFGTHWWTLLADGTSVYAGGEFSGSEVANVLRWSEGTADWQEVGTNAPYGTSSPVWNITRVGSELYIGGTFTQAGNDTNVQYLARMEGNRWVPVGNGLNGPVYAIAEFQGDVYIGGAFTNAGNDSSANYLARLVGNMWTNVGGGLSGTNGAGGTVTTLGRVLHDGW
jgi:hypothetical protein